MMAYILAGGRSRRFGRDKALALVGGQTMLARMCGLALGVAGRVKIVAPGDDTRHPGVPVVADGWPGEGPLGGILTALGDSRRWHPEEPWNLILGCDMPFLTGEWLAFLSESAEKSPAMAVLPYSAHGPEPLCACWRTAAEPALRAAFGRGVRKISEALSQVPTEVLDERAWKRFDSAGRLFWNMNTPADYEEALRVWETEP